MKKSTFMLALEEIGLHKYCDFRMQSSAKDFETLEMGFLGDYGLPCAGNTNNRPTTLCEG